nr:hypothetical protein [Pseudomonas aeruginosa]
MAGGASGPVRLVAAVVLAGDCLPGAARLAGVVLCLADHGGEPGTEQGLYLLEQRQVDALGLQALADLDRAGAGAGQVEQNPAAIFGVQSGEAAGVEHERQERRVGERGAFAAGQRDPAGLHLAGIVQPLDAGLPFLGALGDQLADMLLLRNAAGPTGEGVADGVERRAFT